MKTYRVQLLSLTLAALCISAPLTTRAATAPSGTTEQQSPQTDADAKAASDNDAVMAKIQADSEAVITGSHFSYDPASRRDPFEPLIKAEPVVPLGHRPKGALGMMVAEIALKGLALDPHGSPVALFRGSDNRGYTLRVGDPVYDGRVISIDPAKGNVVFRQQVDDPRRIKPYRDVIKRLNPTDEDETGEGDLDSDASPAEEGA